MIPAEIAEAPGVVVVECRYSPRYKPTGRALDAQVCHIRRLRDGKVTSFHQYLNTANLRPLQCARPCQGPTPHPEGGEFGVGGRSVDT